MGESKTLTPGIIGDGISFNDIMRINTDDSVCFLDNTYTVTAYKVGTSRVGIGVLNDKNNASKGLKYKAYTQVTVVE